MGEIDLRSDTVTRPTAAMRAAMAAAAVGDDVYGEDPTVQRLERRLAGDLGFEAGLFVPSGTQGNLVALMSHCRRGDEYLVGMEAHTYKFEGGGAAVLGSIQPQPVVHADDGSLPLDALAGALKPDDPHFARTRLLALENTWHGRVLPQDYVIAATGWARAHGLATHLDGARLFNAAVASGDHPTEEPAHGGARDVRAGGDRRLGRVDLLLQVRHRERRQPTQRRPLERAQHQDGLEAGTQHHREPQHGRGDERDPHRGQPPDPVSDPRPRQHRGGQPQGGGRDQQRRSVGAHVERSRDQRKDALG